MSDPSLPGCELVHTTKIPREYLDSEYPVLPSAIGGRLVFEKPFRTLCSARMNL